jgi:hypothetical protein
VGAVCGARRRPDVLPRGSPSPFRPTMSWSRSAPSWARSPAPARRSSERCSRTGVTRAPSGWIALIDRILGPSDPWRTMLTPFADERRVIVVDHAGRLDHRNPTTSQLRPVTFRSASPATSIPPGSGRSRRAHTISRRSSPPTLSTRSTRSSPRRRDAGLRSARSSAPTPFRCNRSSSSTPSPRASCSRR